MRRVAVIAVVAGCHWNPGQLRPDADPGTTAEDGGDASSDDAASADAAPPAPFHLRIAALIDGESHLHIKGNQVHWQHYIYAAPGRWNFQILPVTLSGVDWLPTWPDAPDTENRDCNGCISSTTTVSGSVPRVPSTATWTEVKTRRAQGIVQYPNAGNDYELVVLISDYMVGGSDDYIVDVDVVPQ